MPARSVVIGDIIAPRVEIRGLVRGSIAAREVVVHADGQVWGDIYARACQVFLGGQVRGRLSTLDEGDIAGIIKQPASLPHPGAFQLLADGAETPPATEDTSCSPQLLLIRRLEDEAAAALTDHAELEQAFEQRLAQKAGDAMAEVVMLRQTLQTTQTESRDISQKLHNTRTELATHEAELVREVTLREQLQMDLAQREAELAALNHSYGAQIDAVALLRQQKTDLESRLQEMIEKLQLVTERAQNLESAMQASLQHTAEQEEALLRWQELAEVTEMQAANAQYELQKVQTELDIQATSATNLREERAELRRQLAQLRAERDTLLQAESALAEAQIALEELQHLYALSQQEEQRLRQERDDFQDQLALQEETFAALADLRLSYHGVTQRYESVLAQRDRLQSQLHEQTEMFGQQMAAQGEQLARVVTELQEAESGRVTLAQQWETAQSELKRLQEALARQLQMEPEWQAATARASEYADLLVWYKASLQATQQDVLEKEQSLALLQGENAGMAAQLEERDLLVDKWKTNVSRLTELLYAAERRARKLEAALAQYKEATRVEAEQLTTQLRHYQAQHESNELEVTTLHQSVAAQGERLAWLQATLVERDLSLENLQTMFDEQKRTLYSVRQLATTRIRELEQELTEKRRKLNDLTQWLERRRAKTGNG